eukprot:CAMPEP_0180798556 /NCGR_PEP_ID=MMETSP1038_2-20121128/58028_1 /TAXON_ID=632150 /ORGANISM="Azadinium spinosum, Strain 3D9" /LENGTH=32 /DNA_ID= /DNA_START= /DNA_END= /DNA_ORIENTATION=
MRLQVWGGWTTYAMNSAWFLMLLRKAREKGDP